MQLAERNYEIYNKELLAIVEALTKWRQYLLDATERFEIWTNYENLKYFRELYKLNGWQVRWYLKLQDYNFTLYHIPGKMNTKTNVLLRKDQVDTVKDNKDIQLLKKEMWIRKITIVEVTIIQRNQVVEETTLLEEIQRNHTRKQEVLNIFQTTRNYESKSYEKITI